MFYRKQRTTTNYLAPLREVDVYPSFSEIDSLVMSHEESRSAVLLLPVRIAAEGVALIAICLLLGAFSGASVQSTSGSNTSHSSTFTTPQTVLSTIVGVPTHEAVPTSVVKLATDRRMKLHRNIATIASAPSHEVSDPAASVSLEEKPLNLEVAHLPTIEDANVRSSSDRSSIPVVEARSNLAFARIERESSIDRIDESSPLYLYFSGGYPFAMPGISAQGIPSASVGVRYLLIQSSSLLFEIHRGVFSSDRTSLRAGYKDTTFVISGTSYPSTIGTTESVTSQVSNAMFGLEVGYRYEAQLGLRYAPFAEVLSGAALGGMFNSARIGMVFQFTDLVRADCALRLDQLVTSTNAPSRAIGLEATVGYAW